MNFNQNSQNGYENPFLLKKQKPLFGENPFNVDLAENNFSKHFAKPKVDINDTFMGMQTPKTDEKSFLDFMGTEGAKNTMGAIGMAGSLVSGIANYKMARDNKKFQKKVLDMQERQANRLIAKEEANQKAINDGFAEFMKNRKKKDETSSNNS